jgi:hypothetical protein
MDAANVSDFIRLLDDAEHRLVDLRRRLDPPVTRVLA